MESPGIGKLTHQVGWIGAYYPVLHSKGNRRNPRAIRYGMWKDHVRHHLPPGIGETLPSRQDPLRLDVFPVFKNGQHPDSANVRKSVEDAIWKNDKYGYGFVGRPRFDRENPRVIVFIGPSTSFHGVDTEAESRNY